MVPIFDTRAAFHAWLEAQGLAHLARINLEPLAAYVDSGHWPELHRVGAKRRLSDLASADQLARTREWISDGPFKTALVNAVPRLLEAAIAERAQAIAEVPARLRPPDEPRAAQVHHRLLALRSTIGSTIAPRIEAVLDVRGLKFDAGLPGFVFTDWLPTEMPLREGGGFARAKVTLSLVPDQPTARCACGAQGCVHALAAIDTAIRSLREGLSPSVLSELTRPAWQRTLDALGSALKKAPPMLAATDGVLRFHLRVKGESIALDGWWNDTPYRRAELLERVKTTAERALVTLLPDPGVSASKALLESLVDSKLVVLADDPSRAVTIERAEVGLTAEERLNDVRLTASVEGAPLPPALLEHLRRAKPDALLFLWDEGPRRLTLLELKPQVKAALEVLKGDTRFPPESREALLDSLSQWAEQVPVAMPRSVMGARVSAEAVPVLRFTPQPGGGVELDVRIKPLPDAPSMEPGMGKVDLFLRRDGAPVHARRDLRGEEEIARQVLAILPRALAEEDPLSPYRFTFERAEQVFPCLAVAVTHSWGVEWVGKPLRNFGGAGPRSLRVTIEQKNELFGVLGTLSVFGERVELARLVESVRREARFVKVSSHDYVEITEALRQHVRAIADHAHVTKTDSLLVGPAAVEALRGLADAGAEVKGDRAWSKVRARVEQAGKATFELPVGLKATLRSYQLEGYRWLMRLAAIGVGGVLADDMGLGKTVQALAVLAARAEEGPAVVVAPTSVGWNWKEEARRFTPSLRFVELSQSVDRRMTLSELKAGDVLIVSYGLLVREAKRLAKVKFATAVFDEAQELKNANTQRFLAAKSIRAGFTFALSGTPIENHLGELWSLFSLVFPTLLGTWDDYRTRFALPIEKQIDPAAAPALSRVISPFLLRRTKTEVETELPPRTDVRVPVTLSPEEWTLYEDTRLAALSDLESPGNVLREQQRRVQVLAMLTRLRLAAAHPRLIEPQSTLGSAKVTRLLELIDELRSEGQRTLVFSQFTSLLALVKIELDRRRIRYLELDGSTPAGERKARVEAFQDGDAPVFLISLKAGGTGLNLTAATNVILLDPWWNPAVERQAADRAHRPGQTRPVTVYRLVSAHTVEEQMLLLHARKRSLIERVLSGTDAASKVTTDELLALVSRRERAEDLEQL